MAGCCSCPWRSAERLQENTAKAVIGKSKPLAAVLLQRAQKRRDVPFLQYCPGYSDAETGRICFISRSTILHRPETQLAADGYQDNRSATSDKSCYAGWHRLYQVPILLSRGSIDEMQGYLQGSFLKTLPQLRFGR